MAPERGNSTVQFTRCPGSHPRPTEEQNKRTNVSETGNGADLRQVAHVSLWEEEETLLGTFWGSD